VTYQSGPYSVLAESHVNAVNLLVDTWNENGGIQGREINLTIADTEGSADNAIQRTRELIDSGDVDFLGSCLSTDGARAAMNVAGRNNVPLITGTTGARLLVEEACNPYSFRGPTSTLTRAQAGAPLAMNRFGDQVFQLNPDYSWGQEIQEDWQSELEARGANVVDSAFLELGASDFSSAISRIEEADPDFVQVGFAGSGSIAFMNQANQQGLEYPIYFHVIHEPLLRGVSPDVYDTVPVFTPVEYAYSLDNDKNTDFVEAYESEFGMVPAKPAGLPYKHLDSAFQAFDTASSMGADDLVSSYGDWAGTTITGDFEMRACDHQARYPMYEAEVTELSEEGEVTWDIVNDIAMDDLLLSCEEQTSRMSCSVE
jgi:branched-chain amino acid transport system substrate-binding protein